MAFPWAAIAGIVSGGVGAGINYYSTKQTNATNVAIADATNQWNAYIAQQTNATNERLVRETNLQNLQLQHEAWNREDNAVQRRMADLKSAGINPILAAGSAAQASSPVKIDAPHHERATMQQAARMQRWQIETDLVERALRMREDFATNAKTRDLLEANAEEHRARAAQIRQSTEHESYGFDVRLDQVRAITAREGEQAALLNLQQEHQRLVNESRTDTNHGIVLDNVRKELENMRARRMIPREIKKVDLEIAALTISNSADSYEYETRASLGVPYQGSLPEKAALFVWNLGRRIFSSFTGGSSPAGSDAW